MTHSELDTPHSSSAPGQICPQCSVTISNRGLYGEPHGMDSLCTLGLSSICMDERMLTEESSPSFRRGSPYFQQGFHHATGEGVRYPGVTGSFLSRRCERNMCLDHFAVWPVSALHPPQADGPVVRGNTD